MSDLVRIPYDHSAAPLRVEFTDEWNPANIDAIEITITQIPGGTALATSQDATKGTATTLDGASTIGATSISVAGPPGAVGTAVSGDRFYIPASAAGPPEYVVADYVTGTTLYIQRPTTDAHSDGTAIYPMWATYAIDTTSSTYTQGMRVKLKWIPVDSSNEMEGSAITQEGYIGEQAFQLGDLRVDFEAVYPSVYTNLEERWDGVYDAALRRVRAYLRAKDRDIDKLVDQSVLEPAMIEMVYMLGAPRGDEWEYEHSMARAAFDDAMHRVEDSPVWFDSDEDDIVDDGELGVQSWNPLNRGIS